MARMMDENERADVASLQSVHGRHKVRHVSGCIFIPGPEVAGKGVDYDKRGRTFS